ncbi:MAG: thioredoxin family protein [Ignavibacteria bacterium]|nr:thioredoxin family protein [Ignavibacteria bacterium]
MKNSLIALIILGVVIAITFFAIGGLEGNNGETDLSSNDGKSFNEKLEAAKSLNKKIVVSVYTDWCGWCKKMDRETFKNESVISEIVRNFIFIKLNAESSEELTYQGEKYTKVQFAAAFGIKGYPATIFLNSSSDPITVVPGYIDGDMFTKILKFISSEAYLNQTFEKFIEEGKQN